MIPAADAWGPFRPDLEPAEHNARLRCLRAVVHLSTGSRRPIFANLLLRAERPSAALEPALHALDHLAGLDRRHVRRATPLNRQAPEEPPCLATRSTP